MMPLFLKENIRFHAEAVDFCKIYGAQKFSAKIASAKPIQNRTGKVRLCRKRTGTLLAFVADDVYGSISPAGKLLPKSARCRWCLAARAEILRSFVNYHVAKMNIASDPPLSASILCNNRRICTAITSAKNTDVTKSDDDEGIDR